MFPGLKQLSTKQKISVLLKDTTQSVPLMSPQPQVKHSAFLKFSMYGNRDFLECSQGLKFRSLSQLGDFFSQF